MKFNIYNNYAQNNTILVMYEIADSLFIPKSIYMAP